MAGYKEIKGFQVQTRSSDPVPYAQALEDNPYQGTWASGGNMNTARMAMASNGTQTAAIASGGRNNWSSPNFTYNALTEQYNGSSWTEVADLNTARSFTGSGGTSSGQIVAGGSLNTPLFIDETNLVETWNGSAWSETTEINTARNALGGDGASSSATLVVGGKVPPHSPTSATDTDVVESWNGSAWTETGDLNTGRYGMAASGTYTAMIASGGQTNPPPTQVNNVETWNGSSWTEVAEINVRVFLAGAGTSTSQLVFGGSDPGGPGVTTTESWDGSSWTTVNSLATARQMLGGDGASNTSAIAFGGSGDGYEPDKNETEEWSFIGLDPSTTPAADYSNAIVGDFYYNSSTGQFKNIKDGGPPIGSWASGGSLNTGREDSTGAGANAEGALMIAGYTTTRVANVESYDGSSWTEVGDLNVAKYLVKGTGTYTAALAIGGNTPAPAATGQTETWNGSSWTEVNDLNTARQNMGGTGTTTASIAFGGNIPPGMQALAETWNGSSWTEVGDLNTGRNAMASIGTTSTAALAVDGGYPQVNNVESWNGSAWTEIAENNTARFQVAGSGSTTDGLVFGGRILSSPPAAASALTESWDGSSWTEVADLATGRGGGGEAQNISDSTSALFFGGNTGNTNTEEWTAVAFQIKTVTTS